MSSAETRDRGLGADIVVYVVLLALAGLQIVLAYRGGEGRALLARLLVVAIAQAGVAVLFFMHLRTERRSLIWFIAIFTLFVLFAMQYSWTDSFRLINGVPFAH